MADKTVSSLTAATTPLAGTEELHVVQSTNSRKTTIADVKGANVQFDEDTATNIADATATINTTDKFKHKLIVDTTNTRMLYASGANATDPWHVVDGSVTVTPS